MKHGLVTRDSVEIIRRISDELSNWTSKIEELNEQELEEQNKFLREIKFAGLLLAIIQVIFCTLTPYAIFSKRIRKQNDQGQMGYDDSTT